MQIYKNILTISTNSTLVTNICLKILKFACFYCSFSHKKHTFKICNNMVDSNTYT